MNASTVLVLVEWHQLEQDAATALQLALGHYVNRVLPKCKLHTVWLFLMSFATFGVIH